MLRNEIPLGRWAGVPVGAHWSTLATLALFAWLLAGDVLPATVPGHPTRAYWTVGIVTSIVFLATLLAHELAHAVTARHFGMRIRRITLWMLGGLTELDGDPPSARADAWVAAAGPLVSIGLGLVGGAVVWFTGIEGLLRGAVLWLSEVSVFLGVFNLLPGAPLDGGRLLRAILWRHYGDRARANAAAARAGRGLGVALLVLGMLELLAGGLDGIWLALIGWFIMSSAAAERYSVGVERLDEITVEEVMSPVVFTAPNWWTVRQLLDELWAQRAMSAVIPVVDFAGDLTGVVTLATLQRVRPASRESVHIRDLSAHPPVAALPPGAPVRDCLPTLQRGGVVVVVADSRPIGVVTGDEVTRAARLAELRGPQAAPRDERHPNAA